jgi:hypothetical protein
MNRGAGGSAINLANTQPRKFAKDIRGPSSPMSARSVHADQGSQYEEGDGDDGYRVRRKGAWWEVRSRLDGALSSP